MKILKNGILLLFTIVALASCNNSKSGGGLCDNECTYTIAAGETAGTVASAAEGTHNLTFHYAAANSPIADGTKATFTVSDNTLTVEIEGMDCITIKNPISRFSGSTEVSFIDNCSSVKLSFDVSEHNGSLNEVNLSSGDGNFTFLGQFNDR